MIGPISNVYEISTLVVGIENLIMGFTLLILCLVRPYKDIHRRMTLVLISIAMLGISAINLVEYIIGVHADMEDRSLSVVIFAASIELLLFWLAYMVLFDDKFLTFRRISLEVIGIALFTTPPLFLSSITPPDVFHFSLAVSILFYLIKLLINVVLYQKRIWKVLSEIKNLHSREAGHILNWVNATFYLVLAVGIVSVVIPLGNFTILVFYNIFLFFAYLYIYVEILRNISAFNNQMLAIIPAAGLADEEPDQSEKRNNSGSMETTGDELLLVALDGSRKNFDAWMASRSYSIPNITADQVASQFCTNRTKLSLYLNNELQMNFYEWIARLRMEDAKRQLISFPELPVLDIAIRVGIEDRSNFDRIFKKIVGVSPVMYRKSHFADDAKEAPSGE